ncbi:YcgL domain-containing protein [Halomonas aquamarina]|uniref:YcgL domain-containing protein n=1 Tax=Vreelandella aquamarina TaxID=77097 RepID=A0ACC5VXT2_9GAMM|nr:YcgL domain-containing protein [Halomonas aquamarina]MBZ5489050.1 YcgL domain-containing protein [Halomonas aquamarina]
MSDKLLCEIFKSSRKQEMYLYVDKRQGCERVPEALMETFGKPISVLTMILTADKKLARVDAGEVIDAIESQGFYLQMPPAKEDYLLDIHRAQLNARDVER